MAVVHMGKNKPTQRPLQVPASQALTLLRNLAKGTNDLINEGADDLDVIDKWEDKTNTILAELYGEDSKQARDVRDSMDCSNIYKLGLGTRARKNMIKIRKQEGLRSAAQAIQTYIEILEAAAPGIQPEPAASEADSGPQEQGKVLPRPQSGTELERLKLLIAINEEMNNFSKSVELDHLPAALFSDAEKQQFIDRLRGMKLDLVPGEGAFDLSVAARKLSMGPQLLDALHHAPEPLRSRIGLSVLLHELFHFDQGLHTSTYRGIGRAGFVLEEIDYWADAFAAFTLASFDIHRNGPKGRDRAREHSLDAINVIIAGIEAFDRAEQGGRILRLSERRLRRYLIWHLHRSRADALSNIEQLPSLFDRRLVVELSSLLCRLDERGERLVDSAGPDTELMAAYGRVLIRASRSGYLEPAEVVDAVRSFDHAKLEACMRAVRDNHRGILTPWVR